jgi:nitroreductase
MNLNEMISQRRSVRKYQQRPVDDKTLSQILDFCMAAKPLDPHIQTTARLVEKEDVRFYFPWKAPHLLAIYSEPKPGYLENVGFIFQQVDLYIQSLGLGSCWMGLGKLRSADEPPAGMEFVILIAFGYAETVSLRSGPADFQRKALSEISDWEDPRLEPARLAPSSTNSQPWYFIHEGSSIHAYCSEQGILRHKMLGTMNRIDMGIALAQMFVANKERFRFFLADAPISLKGHRYTGSFAI